METTRFARAVTMENKRKADVILYRDEEGRAITSISTIMEVGTAYIDKFIEGIRTAG